MADKDAKESFPEQTGDEPGEEAWFGCGGKGVARSSESMRNNPIEPGMEPQRGEAEEEDEKEEEDDCVRPGWVEQRYRRRR